MTDPRISPDNTARGDQRTVRIGTRGSPLALVQARQIAASLEVSSGGALRGEIVPFTTTGDQLTTERLINSGGKGLFTRELDAALDRDEVDITVHSLKDVPAVLPEGQIFAAFPQREDPREGFLSPHADKLADLPKGAKVGTASLRRESQTLALRPDVEIVTFRGNVATRMRKLEDGLADATYLAMAGLTRLGMAHLATPIPMESMLPSAGQGIIGVVMRDDGDAEVRAALGGLDHAETRAAATAERAFLAALDGSCRTPIAAHLFNRGEEWELIGEVLALDGRQRWRADGTCRKEASQAQLAALGRDVAADIRAAAGGVLPAFVDEW
ncbi:MAG: hydroxymethylbilane synthase [Hyphomonas sp.]|mgnify:FL=1|uniref:hydroxymethylbilane synthase n=1 Tax=Hyphomonas sp. TaxID=87 RepID=UPI0030026D57